MASGRSNHGRLTSTVLLALAVCGQALGAGSASDLGQQGSTRTFFRTEQPDALPPLLRDLSRVTDADLENPRDGEWLSHRGGHGLSGYSPLRQINRDTVSNLELVWSWAMNGRRTQVQPLIHDGVMFLNQSADVIQAIDAATGDLLWSYDR
ncbi:MAG TPA: hypothetical protein QGG47_12900 [Acidobacteriota bacterium]|nr:hypothetical protein [Acidobacteriota bacterium]